MCLALAQARIWRDRSLTLLARHDRAGCIGASASGGSSGGFGVRQGNGAQQKLGEMTESGGLLARDAPLREQAENLSESAVHAGGGGEIAAGGMEFGKVECPSDNVASGRGAAKQLFFSFGVKRAEGGMNIGAGHGALAAIGESKLATVRQWFGRIPRSRWTWLAGTPAERSLE